MNVSPNCDCWSVNDAPVVPDLGIACSFDPVALDCASVDLVNAAAKLPNTALTDKNHVEGTDVFTCIHSNTNWRTGLEHASQIGLGSMGYELVRVD